MSNTLPEMKLIDQVQRKCTRMILNIPRNPSLPGYLTYNERITMLKIITMDQRTKIAQILLDKKLITNPERFPTLNDFINVNRNARNVRNMRAFNIANASTNFAQRQQLMAIQQIYNTYHHLISEVEAHSNTRKKLKEHFQEVNEIR